MFAKRTGWEIRPNVLSQALTRLKTSDAHILDLTESNPSRCGFSYLKPELLEPFLNPQNLAYEPDAHGLSEARQAVLEYYRRRNIELEPEQIFITASTSEAYGFLFRLLCEPGESVLVPSVSYPLFEYLAGLSDLELQHYPISCQTNWQIDLEKLKTSHDEKVRAIAVVNPNNPTGHFVSEAERLEINRLAQDHDWAVMSDEVFLDFAYTSTTKPISFAGNEEALTFTMSGISKILGLPQMKIGWIVVSGPREIRNTAIERLEIIADTYLSANTPAQRAFPMWLEKETEIRGEILERVLSNRSYLAEAIKQHPKFKLLPAEGGWYAILKIDTERSDEELCLALLEKNHLLLQPGYFYDLIDGTYLVLSLIPEEKIFREGVKCLIDHSEDI